jgi:hypothetical protein
MELSGKKLASHFLGSIPSISVTMQYHYTPVKTDKKIGSTHCCEDTEKSQHLSIATQNAKMVQLLQKSFWHC